MIAAIKKTPALLAFLLITGSIDSMPIGPVPKMAASLFLVIVLIIWMVFSSRRQKENESAE